MVGDFSLKIPTCGGWMLKTSMILPHEAKDLAMKLRISLANHRFFHKNLRLFFKNTYMWRMDVENIHDIAT